MSTVLMCDTSEEKNTSVVQQLNYNKRKMPQTRDSSIILADIAGIVNTLFSVPHAGFPHLRRPLSSPILITNQKTKQQSPRCMMRPVFRGSTGIAETSEKSSGNKDPPIVYIIHLPIKMQMSLQEQLGTQMKQ